MTNPPTVAFQGAPGAFSELAAQKYFKNKAKTVIQPSFEDIFAAVSHGQTDFGIVPLENSITGSIHPNYDLLAQHHLFITGEIYLKINHHLLGNALPQPKSPSQRLKLITKVYSHPQALQQCQKFLATHPWMNPIPTLDTAASAQTVAKRGRADEAAIASLEAASRYHLKILQSGIETNKHNITRFVFISRTDRQPQANKVSLLFTVKHQPGALFNCLKLFAHRHINLTKIESRPIIGKPWEYLFYLDFEINSSRKACDEAVEKLKQLCSYVKVLGFYKKGNHV